MSISRAPGACRASKSSRSYCFILVVVVAPAAPPVVNTSSSSDARVSGIVWHRIYRDRRTQHVAAALDARSAVNLWDARLRTSREMNLLSMLTLFDKHMPWIF